MLRRLYPNIRARITAPFLLAVIVIAAMGIFFATRLVAGNIQERLNNQLTTSAQAVASTIVDIERQQLAALRLMTFSEGIDQAVLDRDTATLQDILTPLAANDDIGDVYVFDITGELVFRLTRTVTPEAVTYRVNDQSLDLPAIERVTRGEVDLLGDKFADLIDENDDTTIYISAPVVNIDNVVVGGIAIGINSQALTFRLREQAAASVIVYDDAGQVIGSSFRDAVQENLEIPAAQFTSLVQETIDNSPIEVITIDGLEYQVLYSPFRLRSQIVGVLGVALPADFIADRISTSRDTLALLFSMFFFAVALLGLGVARSITGPVARLVTTTRDIREGDLSRRVNLRTPDELGELSLSFDTMTDQLVQKRDEIEQLYLQQLKETAQRQAILTSVSDALVVMDADNRVLLRNDAAQELAQSLRADHPKAYQQFQALCLNTSQSFTPQSVTLGEGHYSVLAKRVLMETGDTLGHVIVFRDITSLVEAEQLKDEMILQISHEPRTPLARTTGFAQLLDFMHKTNLDDQGKMYLDNVQAGLETLKRLINQVVDVSTILNDRLEMHFDDVNLTALISQAIDRWQPVLQQKDQRLTLTSIPQGVVWIEADPDQINQVLDHVLRNANSYTLAGGWVEIALETTERAAIITITDCGVGIAKDELELVFNRAYRGQSAEAGETDAPGMGMGLYLSRYIVQAHHGLITIDSQQDLGTIVIITLPIKQPES